jgi:hypothetical protein
VVARADRAALTGLMLGLVLYVLPFWREGRLRVAFWLTLSSTLVHIFTTHKMASSSDSGRARP